MAAAWDDPPGPNKDHHRPRPPPPFLTEVQGRRRGEQRTHRGTMAAALSSVNARGNVACFTAKQNAQAPRRGQLQVRMAAWAAGPAPHFAPATCAAGAGLRSFGGAAHRPRPCTARGSPAGRHSHRAADVQPEAARGAPTPRRVGRLNFQRRLLLLAPAGDGRLHQGGA